MDYTEKMQRCHEYVEALEEERRKIQVFQRELPLCLELVTQAIEACRRELLGTTTDYMHGQSECSEQTSSDDGPVLEEFIPIKRAHSSSDVNGNDDDDRDHEQRYRKRNRSGVDSNINDEKACNSNNNSSDHKKKSDWLRSVQLWNQSSDPPPARLELPREDVVTELKRDGVGGAFHPFRKEKSNAKTSTNIQMTKKTAPSLLPSAPSSMAETVTAGANGNGGGGGNSKEEEKDGQTRRKQRRCWSQELHRRFLQALQLLGGSHAATPKQIRDLMKVDGLTNDEVKSHLQKYRLHTRRPSPAMHNTTTSTQAPQFVVVGGIWVPPPEYAAVATTTTTTTSRGTSTIAASQGIYAPLAAPPPKTQHASNSPARRSPHTMSDHSPSEGRDSHCEEGHHSNSPSTSSSTHTTTNSSEF